MQEHVEFESQDTIIRADFYLPEGKASTDTVLLLPGFPTNVEAWWIVRFGQACFFNRWNRPR